MITLVSGVGDHMKESAEAATAFTQGQWGYYSGVSDNENVKVSKIASDAATQYDRDKLCLVFQEPVDIEGTEDDEHDAITSGSMVIALCGKASNILVEDDMCVADSNTAGAFSSASFDDAIYLNATGYPTLSGATDFVTSSTQVGNFHKLENSILWYRLV